MISENSPVRSPLKQKTDKKISFMNLECQFSLGDNFSFMPFLICPDADKGDMVQDF